jgi:DNA-binding SARP family transcriptional activator
MGKESNEYNWDGLNNYDDSGQSADSIRLLELIEKDYQGARQQLESLGRTLGEREALVNQRIQNVKVSSRNSSALCLLSYQSNTTRNQLGTAILGIMKQNVAIPELLRLEIHCLDGFQVGFSHERVERWESIKAKSLLQYLMAKPHKPIAKEELMEALWPDCDPKVSSNNLKAAMHGLRQTLNNLLKKEQNFPSVVFTQGNYQINPKILLWLDVEQFEQHWERGRRLQSAGKLNEAMREFKLAEELYKGDYLVDDPYEEWTLLRREALHDIYLNILSKLTDNYLQNTDYENCIVYCFKILDKDNCREDAYQRVMRCYSRIGLRNRALQWYEICRKTIETELDTEPDQTTMSLYRQLLDNKPI